MNNYFWDTHTHVVDEHFDNKEDVINKAINNNVNYIINSGTDVNSIYEVVKMAEEFDNVYATIGIHPFYKDEQSNEDNLQHIINNMEHKKVLAIGEIGLDYHYDNANKNLQQNYFRKQLKIAEDANMPVVIHSRDATEDTIKILKEYKVTGVIHSFSGSYETAKEYINMGYLLGINGVLTFKNSKMKEWISKIPLENIILETDAPYLTPVPFRGHKNEPANIIHIANYIAKLYDVPVSTLAKITNENVHRIFDKLDKIC